MVKNIFMLITTCHKKIPGNINRRWVIKSVSYSMIYQLLRLIQSYMHRAQKICSIVFLWQRACCKEMNEKNSVLYTNIRGTQGLFSVKYLFREKEICLECSITWGRLKISRWLFHSCKIFEAYLKIPYDFQKFNFSNFTPQVWLFLVEKET